MVMRNRHNGGHSSEWWDDLPPRVKKRVSRPVADDDETDDPPAAPVAPAGSPVHHHHTNWVRELTRLGLLFLAIAIGNILFLLLCLAFLSGGPAPLFVR